MDLALVMTVVPEAGVGEEIAEALVSSRVAACVNIVRGTTSFYWWEGELQRDSEVLLLIKTRAQLVSSAKDTIENLHPYELPEVIVLPISGGSERYVSWLFKETTR